MNRADEKKFRYEVIADYISEAIDEGSIPYGSRLPSLRIMSSRFSCAVSVVMQAYEELEKQGKAYAVEKSGFFAASPFTNPLPTSRHESYSLKSEHAKPVSIIGKLVEASNDSSILQLGAGLPHESLLPIAALKKSVIRVLRDEAILLKQYTDEEGDLNLRTEICRMLLNRGVNVHPDEVLITNGCIEALSFAVQASTSPGDAVAIESPVYMGAIDVVKGLDRKLIPIPTSASEGIDLDSLESVLKKGDVKAVFMTAAFQNPLGFVMPVENRKKAVFLAGKYGAAIIEDDLYNDCSHNLISERSLKSFDRSGQVIYCSSFSKTISPGMRIGWLIGGNFHSRCRNIKISQTLGGSSLLQAALADFLKHGRYENHVRKFQRIISKQAREMKMLLSASLPDNTAISSPRGGFFLWIELPEKVDTLELFSRALDEKISIAPGQAFCTGKRFSNCFRISFVNPVTDETREGIKKLGQMIEEAIDQQV